LEFLEQGERQAQILEEAGSEVANMLF